MSALSVARPSCVLVLVFVCALCAHSLHFSVPVIFTDLVENEETGFLSPFHFSLFLSLSFFILSLSLEERVAAKVALPFC